MVVASSVKKLFKQRGAKTSQSAIEALHREVEKLCLKALDKAVADKVKIVKGSHIPSLDPLLDTSKDENI